MVFQYYDECVQEFTSTGMPSLAPIISSVIALIALIVAVINLYALKNAQSLVAKINLINVEVEMRKSYTEFKNLFYEIDKTQDINEMVYLTRKKQTSLERYISMADKLASLILYVKKIPQYKDVTNWKAEYQYVFEDVIATINSEASYNRDRVEGLSKNVNKVLVDWNQE